jgi:hypothetical protein
MSTTETTGKTSPQASNDNLSYDVFINDPPPQDGLFPNGEPKVFSREGQHADLRERGCGAGGSRDDGRSGACAR